MANAVYRLIELTGTSPNSIEEAVNNAIARAGESMRMLRWFEVTETRGVIDNNRVAEWQVTVKIGFHVE